MSNIKILKEAYPQKAKESLVVAFIDGQKTPDLAHFYTQIAEQLAFPAYFGDNLDALYDCLCDLSWLDAREIHIVFKDYDVCFANETKNRRWDVLALLNDAGNEWKALKGKDKIKFEIFVEPSARIKQDLDDAEV